jgi:hypothetical protein
MPRRPSTLLPKQWEAALRARELRAARLRDEVNAVDARVEGRIDALLEALRAIGDSKDSRTKVARMKRDTIDRLQKTSVLPAEARGHAGGKAPANVESFRRAKAQGHRQVR